MVIDLTSGINEQCKPLIAQLSLLPCFVQQNIKKVFVIDSGLSQPCFRVQTDDNEYFAKQLTSDSTELFANRLASDHGIAPTLIYAEGEWLISEFLSGELLANCKLSEDKRLAVTLSLLTQCHALPLPSNSFSVDSDKDASFKIPRLAIEQTLTELFQDLLPQNQLMSDTKLSLSERNSLMAISTSVLKKVTQTSNEVGQSQDVFCHGDANFSNIIKATNVPDSNTVTNANHHYQLIDFGCSSVASIEYDIAMLMAVNEIEASKTERVIAEYCHQRTQDNVVTEPQSVNQQYLQNIDSLPCENQAEKAPEIVDNLPVKTQVSADLSKILVTCYYDLSLIINSLWYLSQYQQRKVEKYKKLANKQYSLLAIRYPKTNIVIN
jgi:thiamine kinase-like enzyme